MQGSNKKNHLLMIVLVLLWVVDALAVSSAVESTNPIVVVFLKTLFSLPVLALAARIMKQSLTVPEKRDIPLFILCALLGDVLYFFFEYSAYRYLSIGMVTVLIGMTPLISYLVDCAVQKKKPDFIILVLIVISIFGLGIAVLSDESADSMMGYVFCALASATWIVYGYALNTIGSKYELIPLTFYESCISVFLMLPFAILFWPQEGIELATLAIIAVMGMLMNGIGYILENNGLLTLGTTIAGLYVNMLPVVTSIAGFVFLNETMSVRQIIGSAIVILCCAGVILLSGREEKDAGAAGS